MTTYDDGVIRCDGDGVTIRRYYFPWGAKRIPYGSIKGMSRVALSAFRGRARIWGTANFKYWASLDPKRPTKSAGLILDLGHRVKPFITPDDPDAFEALVRQKAGLPDGGPAKPSPFV